MSKDPKEQTTKKFDDNPLAQILEKLIRIEQKQASIDHRLSNIEQTQEKLVTFNTQVDAHFRRIDKKIEVLNDAMLEMRTDIKLLYENQRQAA